jgi:hypothetical protein
MGSWGLGSFEDDVAVDWLEDLYDSDAFAFFSVCLDLSGERDLGHVACVGVVCTAEIIHGLLRGPRQGLPDAAVQWIENHQHFPADLFRLAAVAGLLRVLDSASEMHQRWEDQTVDFLAWRSHIGDLLSRLQRATSLRSDP